MVYRARQASCPRCGARLDAEQSGVYSFRRCPSCRGVWMEESTFKAMLEEMGGPVDELAPSVGAEEPVTCSLCSKPMEKKALSAIVLDRCEHHGIWFDNAELQKTLAGAAGLPVDPQTPLDRSVSLLQQALSPPKKP